MTVPSVPPALTVRIMRTNEITVLHLTGVVDLAAGQGLRVLLRHLLAAEQAGEAPELVVDLSAVSLLDASGIGILVNAHKQAGQRLGRLRVQGACGRVLTALEITGDAKSLGVYSTVDPPDETAEWRDDTAEALLGARLSHGAAPAAAEWLRQQCIEYTREHATRLARRYRDRGESLDDLIQVAMVGLLKAVDGYDPSLGYRFTAYATPTILGEIKRHFRDHGWQVRVPRRVQELGLQLTEARAKLTQTLHRSPTTRELADTLCVTAGDVVEVLDAGGAYRPVSLSTPVSEDADTSLGDELGKPDPGFDAVEYRESLRVLIARLPERQQRILALRFFGNQTQSEIAEALGISQMHVSRLLAGALQRLRRELDAA
jgi:RNA polymerase sigma-B factor